MVGGLLDFFIAFGGQRDYDSGAGFDFFQIRHRLLVARHRPGTVHILRRDNHYGKILVDQGVGAMLISPAG